MQARTWADKDRQRGPTDRQTDRQTAYRQTDRQMVCRDVPLEVERMVGGNSHRSWYIQPTYVRQRACAHHPATSGQPAEGLRAQGCAHTSSSAPTQGHRSLTSPASWRSGRGEHQPAPAPLVQSQPAVTAGSQGQPASVRAGCCSARGHAGWLLLSQGSEGGLGQSPRQMVGWDPAGRAGGRLLRSMRNETSSGAGPRRDSRARGLPDCGASAAPLGSYCSYKLERALLEEGQQKPGQQAPLLQ